METKFYSKGFVLGNYWGGEKSAYPARIIDAETKEELLETANTMLESGSLDSGMGYESLIGAVLDVTKVTILEYEGQRYRNYENETVFIGNLTDEDKDFLEQILLEQTLL